VRIVDFFGATIDRERILTALLGVDSVNEYGVAWARSSFCQHYGCSVVRTYVPVKLKEKVASFVEVTRTLDLLCAQLGISVELVVQASGGLYMMRGSSLVSLTDLPPGSLTV